METKRVSARYRGGLIPAEFKFTLEPPFTLEVDVPDIFNCLVTAGDLFEAFKKVRVKARELNLEFECNGAKRNVFPSRMSRSMAGGKLAYELTMGKQARKTDMVDIFDFSGGEISSPEDQEKFYSDWLQSLG
ncbi:hypothetical protein [Microbulbifer sp. YPW1]|uniref:hypothetical protein n=1 Tax=Microbulbifer sp. YPW1 TaxID=2745199 RepID=UPI00159A960C|nr:hypothetical protein [Microbulbifer sp. YPW1]QKX15515.1 hypothetical protein HUW35_12200 [Microbulbifer sp. YPW1]